MGDNGHAPDDANLEQRREPADNEDRPEMGDNGHAPDDANLAQQQINNGELADNEDRPEIGDNGNAPNGVVDFVDIFVPAGWEVEVDFLDNDDNDQGISYALLYKQYILKLRA